MKSQQDDDPESKFDSDEGQEKLPGPNTARCWATVGKPWCESNLHPTASCSPQTVSPATIESRKTLKKDPMLNFLIVFQISRFRVGDTWKDDFEAIAQLDKTLKQGVKNSPRISAPETGWLTGRERTEDGLPDAAPRPNGRDADFRRLLSGKIVFDHQRGQIVSREMQVERPVLNGAGAKTIVNTVMTQSERLIPNPRSSRSASNEPSHLQSSSPKSAA